MTSSAAYENKDSEESVREQRIKELKSKLTTSESSYWGKRIRRFIDSNPDDAFEKTKEAICNDSIAWSVFSALLMTVGAAALTIGEDDFIEDTASFISIQYVLYNSFSFGLSFVAVVVGTQKYAYYNNIPENMIDLAISNNKQIPVEPLIYIAIVLQGLGVTMGVVGLYQGGEDVCSNIASVICVMLLIIAKYLDKKSTKLLGL